MSPDETQPDDLEDILGRRELDQEHDGSNLEVEATVQRLREQYGRKTNDLIDTPQLRVPGFDDPEMWIVRVAVCAFKMYSLSSTHYAI